jgi:hypothetical protein
MEIADDLRNCMFNGTAAGNRRASTRATGREGKAVEIGVNRPSIRAWV